MAWMGISTRDTVTPIDRGGWLDALRFIVAFMMILHHYELAAPTPLKEFHPVFERGYLLTNFFLIDSGYVLARIYGERVRTGGMTAGEFFRRRFLRVVPAHLMMCSLLIAMVLSTAVFGIAPRNPEWFDWSQLPAQFFLVQAFGVPGGLGWNAPSWSISALLGCYLAFPWLLRLTTRWSPWAVLGLGAGVFLGANLLTWELLGYPVYQMPMKYGIWRALPLFLLGMCLARFAQKVYLPPRLAGWTGVLAAVALAVVQYYGRFSLISLGLISLIIIAAGAIPVVRKSALVERAALASFAIFISNEVVRIGWFGVVNIVQERFDWSEPMRWAAWAASIPVALIFAFAFHWWIDMPSQRWLNRDRRPAPRTAPTAASA